MSSHLKMMSLSLLAASILISHAQTNPPAPDLIQKIKQPISWMNWGGDLRIRNEYFNNLLTLNPNSRLHEQDYFRFRARVWTTIAPWFTARLRATGIGTSSRNTRGQSKPLAGRM